MTLSVVAMRLEDADEVGAWDVVYVAREGEGTRRVIEPDITRKVRDKTRGMRVEMG